MEVLITDFRQGILTFCLFVPELYSPVTLVEHTREDVLTLFLSCIFFPEYFLLLVDYVEINIWIQTQMWMRKPLVAILLLILPLALQLTVGFGLSKNVLPFFFPICHQLSPSSHSQHLKISFYFLFPSFAGSSLSFRLFQFLSEDLFVYPILLHYL